MDPDGQGLEIGSHVARIREAAGISQAELARRITWSPAVLSRAEGGLRPLAPEELDSLLAEIGTPEAKRLIRDLGREWHVIPRPPLDHPDADLLWEAERVARELAERRHQDPDIRKAFERRLDALLGEFRSTAGHLLQRNYRVAFMGPIGVGKSTAICRLLGLEVAAGGSGPASPVLEAGAGGITMCEVHIRLGPGHGLMVEGRSEEEIRSDVQDFAEYLMKGTGAADDEDQEHQGISKEIERAIRNMAQLPVRRFKDAEGNRQRRDMARELADEVGDVRELVVEILARMGLHARDRHDIWHDPASGKKPLVWLKETFEAINNGRHADFALPRRIEVLVPIDLLGDSNLNVCFIDTKGIDRTASRADLEAHFDDSHTLTVLCSGFNNAPGAETHLLLERARQAGARELIARTAVLGLPRSGEALAVKDESGIPVESDEEGYELKAEQVAMALQPLDLEDLAVEFFNAHRDLPERMEGFLVSRLESMRADLRDRLVDITQDGRALLANADREQTLEVLRHAGTMLRTWMAKHHVVEPLPAHVHDSLMEEIARAYASTIHAAVRREGEWVNLSYSHQLGHGARRLAVRALDRSASAFADLCETMSANPDYAEAKDLLSQAARSLMTGYEELLRKAQLMGETAFPRELRTDPNFWVECGSEWGQGSGYRARVSTRTGNWFDAASRQEMEAQLWGMVAREWRDVLNRVEQLLEDDPSAA